MRPTDDPSLTLEYVMDIISDGVWDWNVLTGHVDRNPGWYRMLGYEVDCLNKDVLTWENVIHPDDYPKVMAHFEDYVSGRVPEYKIQYRCICQDSSAKWIEDSGRIVEQTPEGKPARMIGAHTDIDALKSVQAELEQKTHILEGKYHNLEQIIQERTEELARLNQKLEEKVQEVELIASKDALTDTYNRRMFEQFIEIEIKRAQRYSQPMCVILADIDLFKSVNDLYGHSVGDRVLQNVAHTLKSHIRESDILARWGGEEFALILPNTTTDVALQLGERLRNQIETLTSEQNIKVTCSFGITQFAEEDSGDSIFSRMDQALYLAKDSSRNTIRLMPR